MVKTTSFSFFSTLLFANVCKSTNAGNLNEMFKKIFKTIEGMDSEDYYSTILTHIPITLVRR